MIAQHQIMATELSRAVMAFTITVPYCSREAHIDEESIVSCAVRAVEGDCKSSRPKRVCLAQFVKGARKTVPCCAACSSVVPVFAS